MDKKENSGKPIYYLKSFFNDELLSQIEWSKSQLYSNDHVVNNFNLFQGQIVYIQYFEYKGKQFRKNLALVLDDSRDFENDAIICPLIPLKNIADRRLGIDIGKIPCVSTEYDFIAIIPAIKRINKNYIKLNNSLTNTRIDTNYVYKILNTYKNMLSNIIDKRAKIQVAAYC